MAVALDSSAEQTLKTLEGRLVAAERESKRLSKNIKTFGFSTLSLPSEKFKVGRKSKGAKSLSSEVRDGKRDDLSRNLDHRSSQQNEKSNPSGVDFNEFKSRVSVLEETLSSLYTCVDEIKAEKRRVMEEKSGESRNVNETVLSNMEQLKDEYNKVQGELRGLQTKNVQLKKKLRSLERTLEVKNSDVDKLKEEIRQLSTEKERIQLTSKEIGKALEDEVKTRKGLEETGLYSLEKIKELEKALETEKVMSSSLREDIKTLQRDLTLAKDALLHEQDERLKLHSIASQYGFDSERANLELTNILQQKKSLQVQCDKLNKENMKLMEQINCSLRDREDTKKALTKLGKENTNLQEAIKIAATDNRALISQQRELIDRERAKLATKFEEQEKKLASDKEGLKKERDELNSCIQQLRKDGSEKLKEIEVLTAKLMQQEKTREAAEAKEKETFEKLTTRIREVTKEKEDLSKHLSSEIDKVKEELLLGQKQRDEAFTLIKEFEIERERMVTNLRHLKEENNALKERILKAEEGKMSQTQIERVIAELVESKNKLAYEKGTLESEVDQMRVRILAMAGAKEENAVIKQTNSALQSQYNKVVIELQRVRRDHQQAELELKKAKATSEAKELEIHTLLSARNENSKEVQKVLNEVGLVEKRYAEKVASLEASLQSTLRKEQKLTADLQGMASSHSHVQGIVEHLQTELGKKDRKIQMLESDRAASHDSVRQMRTEMNTLQSKLDALMGADSSEVNKLVKELARLKKEGKRFSDTCKILTDDKEGLRKTIDELTADKGKYAERIANIRKESAEKLKLAEAAHSEIHHNSIREQEKLKATLADAKRTITSKEEECEELKRKNEALKKAMQTMKKNQEALEQRNATDLNKVKAFMEQVNELQSDIKVLAKSRDDAERRLRRKEEESEKETIRRIETEDKCKHLEQRLFEASKQNDEIAADLRESEEWFRKKVALLENEMAVTRGEKKALEQITRDQQQAVVEEKEKSFATSENAKQMLKASRLAVNRLADRVVQNEEERKELKYLFDQENHQAIRAVQKYEKLLEASSRRVEELAKELDKAHEKARRKK